MTAYFTADLHLHHSKLAGLRGLASIKIDRFSLPADKLEEVIQRDALPLLGLTHPKGTVS